jgi:hypothetical protein
VPQDFIADREKLRGAKFDVAAMTRRSRKCATSFAPILQWIETQLGDGRPWIDGDRDRALRRPRLS